MSPKARTRTVSAVLATIAVVILALVATSIASSGQGDDTTTIESAAASTTTSTTDPGPTDAEVDKLNRAIDLNAWNQAVWINTTNEQTWIANTNERLAAEQAAREAKAAAAREAAQEAARNAPAPSAPRSQPSEAPVAEQGTGRCGGDLPPCYVMMRESGGNIRAENPTSTASGKWQFLDSTWAGFGGYSHASHAPESVQDAKARILWAGGAGCSHWSAC